MAGRSRSPWSGRKLRSKPTNEQAAAAAKEIDALTTEHEQVQAQIRHTSPRHAALTEPVPLGLKEIQSDVLDNETLPLEYALGEGKSFLWVVTPTSIRSFELPKRAEIEPVARRVYELLITRNRNLPNETPERRRWRWEQADAEYPKASATLARMLLGPVAFELRGKRLLVVSDGVLQYLPFAALPNPGVPNSRPLVADHEVVSLPSASVVVASLWQIDDRATTELMKRFYRWMLGDGLRPLAALRAAQVSMWKEGRWQAPRYWAAFTFQGEWK